MKTRDKTLVPRNPFAVAASQRKAGAHEKTEKNQTPRRPPGTQTRNGPGGF